MWRYRAGSQIHLTPAIKFVHRLFMRDLSHRFWLGLMIVGAVVGGAVAIVSDYSVAGTLILIALGAFAGPLGAFLAGMVMFTVREEREAFNERHPPDR